MLPPSQRETSSTDSTGESPAVAAGSPRPGSSAPRSGLRIRHAEMRPHIRIALWCGIIAIPLSLAPFASVLIGSAIPGSDVLGWVAVGLTYLAPMLMVIGALAFALEYGPLPRVHTFLTAVAAAAALGLGAAARAAWLAGFDAADIGQPAPALSRLFLALFLASCAAGAIAVAIALDGLIGEQLRLVARTVIGIGAGLAMVPLVGITIMMTPFAVTGASATLVVLATLYRPRPPFPPAAPPAPSPASPVGTAPSPSSCALRPTGRLRMVRAASPADPESPATRRFVRALGACAAVLGLVAVGCVLKDLIATSGEGARLLAAAMRIGFLAFLPLLAAVGLRLSERSPYAPVHTWGPVALAGLAAAVAATAFRGAPLLDRPVPTAAVSAVCVGAAVTWVIIRRAPLPAAPRIALGVVAGPTCVALAMPALPALAIVPLVGGLMIVCRRAPRPARADASARP